MGYNKFQDRDGVVFLDLTEDTVTESDVLEGVTFHKADGEEAVGTLVAGGDNPLTATDDSTMEALLVSDNVGKVAQFNGTSDTYVDGGYYLIEALPSTITFTVSGVSYQAEEGMTWGEFINSTYNTYGFCLANYWWGGTGTDNRISNTNWNDYTYIQNSGGTEITSDYVIDAQEAYVAYEY